MIDFYSCLSHGQRDRDKLVLVFQRPIIQFYENPRRNSVVNEGLDHLGILRGERSVLKVASEIVTINRTIGPIS
jgi:hypothetical protein